MWDNELGLVYYNWRYYDKALANWLQRDRILTLSNNLYQYCKGSPVYNIDILGNYILVELHDDLVPAYSYDRSINKKRLKLLIRQA